MRKSLCFGLLIGFASLALVGIKLAAYHYGKMLEVRLDPSHVEMFSAENLKLQGGEGGDNGQLKRIVLFGDSRMEDWKKLPMLQGHEIFNRGIGGDTTAQALLRLDRDVIAISPDLVVIQLGINDLKAIGVLPEKSGWIVKQVKANITQMTAQLNQRGIHVRLMTILPAAEPDLIRRLIWSDKIDLAIANINDFIRNHSGKDITIIDCDPVFNDQGKMRLKFALDTLHLNESGYNEFSSLILDSIASQPVSGAKVQN